MTAASNEVTVHSDGRHELAPQTEATIADSPLYNADLAPVPLERRNWTTYSYMALWIGMAINIPSWTLAAGLIALGMDWVQAVFTVMLGNVIVLVPMLLISHAGTKYGIPYPVFARSSFGVLGANLPALIRAGVACGWFGIQTWIGGLATFGVIGAILGPDSWWATATPVGFLWIAAQPWTLWLSFLIFWLINLYIILKGMNTLRVFESWSAPFLVGVAVLLTIWMIAAAGGVGPILDQPNMVDGVVDLAFDDLLRRIRRQVCVNRAIMPRVFKARSRYCQNAGVRLSAGLVMTTHLLFLRDNEDPLHLWRRLG